MKFFLQFLAVFALALVCQCKNINGHLNFARSVDQCPDFSALGNFSLDSFMGVWHEILRYPNPMEVGCSCVVSDYEVNKLTDEGKHIILNMTYVQNSESRNSALNVLYPNNDNKAEFVFMPEYNKKPNVFFLDTDYSTYALQYGCDTLWGYGTVEFAFILSRTETLPADLIETLKQELATKTGTDVSQFEEPQHTNCAVPQ